MQKKALVDTLLHLGLSEKEAQVYIAGLSLGQTTILQIARSTDINRTTVYSIIEGLKQKGLMRTTQRGWKKWIVAENPDRLEILLEQRKEYLNKTLPEFQALYNYKEHGSFIAYHEGIQSIRVAYEEVLSEMKKGEDYCILSNTQKWIDTDPFFKSFIQKRSTYPINTRLLLQDTSIAKKYKTFEKNYNFKIKILPQKIILTSVLTVTPHTLLIHQLIDPPFAISIKNKSMIDTQKEMFEIMWASAS